VRWWPTLVLSACAAPAAEGRALGTSEVVFKCSVKDAVVSLDGVPQGTCADFAGEPKGLKVKKGAHHVEAKKDGLSPWESWVETDGTRVVVQVNLVPAGGSP
jgi:hypothetical protein